MRIELFRLKWVCNFLIRILWLVILNVDDKLSSIRIILLRFLRVKLMLLEICSMVVFVLWFVWYVDWVVVYRLLMVR